jgi:hypothetical protein
VKNGPDAFFGARLKVAFLTIVMHTAVAKPKQTERGDKKCLAPRQKNIERTSFENSSLSHLTYAFLSYAYQEASLVSAKWSARRTGPEDCVAT